MGTDVAKLLCALLQLVVTSSQQKGNICIWKQNLYSHQLLDFDVFISECFQTLLLSVVSFIFANLNSLRYFASLFLFFIYST
jgi:hypothetical protein